MNVLQFEVVIIFVKNRSAGDDSQNKELLLNTLSDFSPISRIEDSRADVTS